MQRGVTFEEFNSRVRDPGAAREDTFLNSPMYYLLTGRYGAQVHEGYGSVMVTCDHPNLPDRTLAFPEIGAADGRLAASVLSAMDPPRGVVQLARYSEADLKRLEEALARREDKTVAFVKAQEEMTLDWRYPVHILSTFNTAAMAGGSYNSVRNKFRKAEGRIGVVGLDDPAAPRLMRAAVKYWEGGRIYQGHDLDGETAFFETLIRMIEEWPHLFKGSIFMDGRRPVGFSVCDTPFADTANLLANLTDTSVSGLAEFQVVSTCRALAAEGVAYLNRGGSETETLDQFKRKFNPVRSLAVHSAEVVYAGRRDPKVRSGILSMAPASV